MTGNEESPQFTAFLREAIFTNRQPFAIFAAFMLSIFINILLAFNAIVCLLLILLTLMQRPKNEGLGAAFGGGMTDNLFGAQTSNVLAKATRVLGTAFFVITLTLSVLYTRLATSPSSVQAQLASKPVPSPAANATADKQATVEAAIEAKLKEAAAKATPAAPATPVPAATPAASATPAVSATPAATPA